MTANPFKPTAGKMPPILVGRQNIIDDFQEALANGAGAPGRLMLIMGQRGYGKTVMLTELRRLAEDAGWVTLSETASEGLAARLVRALNPKGWRVESATVSPSIGIPGIASASLGNASITFDDTAALTFGNRRSAMVALSLRLGMWSGALKTRFWLLAMRFARRPSMRLVRRLASSFALWLPMIQRRRRWPKLPIGWEKVAAGPTSIAKCSLPRK